jgi:hypothetical protein
MVANRLPQHASNRQPHHNTKQALTSDRADAERRAIIKTKRTKVSRLMRDPRFGPKERLVGWHITERMYGANLKAWARHKDLAELVGCSTRTVQSAGVKLEQFGYVKKRFDGAELKTWYTFLLDDSGKDGVEKSSGGGASIQAIGNPLPIGRQPSNPHPDTGDRQALAAPIGNPLPIESIKVYYKILSNGESPAAELACGAGRHSRAGTLAAYGPTRSKGGNQGEIERALGARLGPDGGDLLGQLFASDPAAYQRLIGKGRRGLGLAIASDEFRGLLTQVMRPVSSPAVEAA